MPVTKCGGQSVIVKRDANCPRFHTVSVPPALHVTSATKLELSLCYLACRRRRYQAVIVRKTNAAPSSGPGD
jgi:hypothetical protein